MSSVFVYPVEYKILAKLYKDAPHVSFGDAETSVRVGIGILAFIGEGVTILYGVSYHKEHQKYVMYVNFAGHDFFDEFDSLQEIMDAYGMNFGVFRYISVRDLNRAMLDYRREGMTEARTNSER